MDNQQSNENTTKNVLPPKESFSKIAMDVAICFIAALLVSGSLYYFHFLPPRSRERILLHSNITIIPNFLIYYNENTVNFYVHYAKISIFFTPME
jgi:hypothetical protein